MRHRPAVGRTAGATGRGRTRRQPTRRGPGGRSPLRRSSGTSPCWSPSTIRHISSAQSLARLGVATMLMRSLSQTVNGWPALRASTSAATKYPNPASCGAGQDRTGPVHPVHRGDPGDRAVPRPLADDELARQLQHPVEVDRVGRGRLVGAGLRPVEDPVRRDEHDLRADVVGGVDEVAGRADVRVPTGAAVRRQPRRVVEDRAVDDRVRPVLQHAGAHRLGVGEVQLAVGGGDHLGPWRSANTFTTLLPTNPDPPVTNTRTMPDRRAVAPLVTARSPGRPCR